MMETWRRFSEYKKNNLGLNKPRLMHIKNKCTYLPIEHENNSFLKEHNPNFLNLTIKYQGCGNGSGGSG